MTRIFLISVLFMLPVVRSAAEKPWKMRLSSPSEKINLVLDLYEESVEVPNMEMFGPMNGYMNGNIYGVWTVTSFRIVDDRTAKVNFSNDLGSETQNTVITQTSDSTWTMKFEGANVVKRVNGKKLVRIPGEVIFRK